MIVYLVLLQTLEPFSASWDEILLFQGLLGNHAKIFSKRSVFPLQITLQKLFAMSEVPRMDLNIYIIILLQGEIFIAFIRYVDIGFTLHRS